MDELIVPADFADGRRKRIALYRSGKTKPFTGICKGAITTAKRGKDGFGYDPIFKAEGFEQTFAEISLDEKNEVGHRGKAVRQLVAYLTKL
ncbi:non-canonical purine NTP pyrophosphatase [Subsaximicrobium wynnwilliamsii]|uniref:non-canonical purine NTP pyrophosphatase n=1 Tax=Subsaximicrobium wynnwilliamsii TaxID=291179 RepID=UPI001CB8CE20|nr:non-canonical purine NTP pyrophosphatase [Subsaximicrobium wynnwilliamsii]